MKKIFAAIKRFFSKIFGKSKSEKVEDDVDIYGMTAGNSNLVPSDRCGRILGILTVPKSGTGSSVTSSGSLTVPDYVPEWGEIFITSVASPRAIISGGTSQSSIIKTFAGNTVTITINARSSGIAGYITIEESTFIVGVK